MVPIHVGVVGEAVGVDVGTFVGDEEAVWLVGVEVGVWSVKAWEGAYVESIDGANVSEKRVGT